MNLWTIDLLKPFGQGWSRNGHKSFASLHHGLAKDRSAFGWTSDQVTYHAWLKHMKECKNHGPQIPLLFGDAKADFNMDQIELRVPKSTRDFSFKGGNLMEFSDRICFVLRTTLVRPAKTFGPIAPPVHKVLLTKKCAKELQHFYCSDDLEMPSRKKCCFLRLSVSWPPAHISHIETSWMHFAGVMGTFSSVTSETVATGLEGFEPKY